MTENQNEPTKTEVQTTKLNKIPALKKNDTEFSAEVAAEAFEQNQSASEAHENNEQ
ncbi:hypothetical protein MHI37_25390 [Paenibacillus sp. FSL H8-0548]|uniref:hypothetical protein n=1 Tax=Paenibacillus sp. FSL H8-0548 TaxID=1920422 RepID=UPI0015C3183B|nr:hypothetical protein [Paenibacillus sp. FSL H8-0548]